MNQVGCRSIPLETVGEERVRATQRFWLVFRLPLLSLQGSRASAALVVVRAAGAQLCAALLGWLAGRRWLQRLRACGRFDGVQGFAKPRVFCSLDFIHKGSSLMFKFLIKERRLSTLHKRFLCQQKRETEREYRLVVLFLIAGLSCHSFLSTTPRRDLFGFLMQGKC